MYFYDESKGKNPNGLPKLFFENKEDPQILEMLQTKAIYLLNHEIVEQIVAPGLFKAAMSKLFISRNIDKSIDGNQALVVSSGEFKSIV